MDRPDTPFESPIRLVFLGLVLALWSTAGLVMWAALVFRVGCAYTYYMFRAAAGKHDANWADSRLTLALHWWIDGFERIWAARNPTPHEPEPAREDHFWQEAAFCGLTVASLVGLKFVLPSVTAIFLFIYQGLSTNFEKTKVVEKSSFVDRPVDKIVEKRIEVPTEWKMGISVGDEWSPIMTIPFSSPGTFHFQTNTTNLIEIRMLGSGPEKTDTFLKHWEATPQILGDYRLFQLRNYLGVEKESAFVYMEVKMNE